MSKIRSAPKCGKKPPEKRLCQSILSRDLKSIYLARGKRFLYATPQTRIASRLSPTFKNDFKSKTFFARKMFLLSSISNANRVQAQPGSLRYPSPKNSPPDCFSRRNCVSPVGSFESPLLQFDKKRRSHNGTFFFWRRRGDSLRYPSPKNSPPDCFSRKSFRFFGRLIRVPPSPIR